MFDRRVEQFKQSFTVEFQRKGRLLKEFTKWKATEFRHFLLYSGPFILKGIISDAQYNHFMQLNVAISTLISPVCPNRDQFKRRVTFAKHLLRSYVSEFRELYGAKHLVYCVHALVHLADDVEHFEMPLDGISSFPFENHLGAIKKLLRGRSSKKVLASFTKRLSEFQNHDRISRVASNAVAKEDSRSAFECLIPGSKTDSFCMTTKGDVIKVRSVSGNIVQGHRLKIAEQEGDYANFFYEPVKATELGIFISSGFEDRVVNLNISHFADSKKCIVHCYESSSGSPLFLIMPLLHHKLK